MPSYSAPNSTRTSRQEVYSNVTSAHLSITRASTILPLSSTFANKEKVWKKEQADIAEKAKIEQLQKEIEQNRAVEDLQQQAVRNGAVKKKDEKLDWMYVPTQSMV